GAGGQAPRERRQADRRRPAGPRRALPQHGAVPGVSRAGPPLPGAGEGRREGKEVGMPGKFARWAVALVAGLALLAGARADEDEKPKEEKKEIKIPLPEPYAKAAKACQECMKACGAAMKVCAEKVKDGEKQYGTPYVWMPDTAQSCQLTLLVIIRNGPALKLVGETCAKVC